MAVGAALQRLILVFGAIVLAVAAWLFITPPGSAPANDRAAVYTGVAKAEPKPIGRLNPDADPIPVPESDEDADERDEPALPEVANAAGEPLSVSAECEQNMALAAKNGLTLPKGWDIKCVGPATDWNGNSHWGVTCPYDACPEGSGPYVSISNPNYYVVTHELCHANFGNDELAADSCAAEHGASLETSPYQ